MGGWLFIPETTSTCRSLEVAAGPQYLVNILMVWTMAGCFLNMKGVTARVWSSSNCFRQVSMSGFW